MQNTYVYIFNETWNVVKIIYGLVKNLAEHLCKKTEEAPDCVCSSFELYENAVKTGDLVYIQQYGKNHMHKNDDMCLTACELGYKNIVEYYLTQGIKNINECLKISCQNNRYEIAELLVQKGASPIIGLRVSKSPNITRMLYRYDQKSENNC